jgi:4-amino-4-deoxy-L-arabinose transferase-like glycosyltransferase
MNGPGGCRRSRPPGHDPADGLVRRRRGGPFFGLLAGLMTVTSFLFVLLARSALLDMLLALWTTLTCCCSLRAIPPMPVGPLDFRGPGRPWGSAS